jgi:hypothetical protein
MTEHDLDKDAADFLVLFGPLVVIDEERKWAVPVATERPRQPPEFKHIMFASVDDIDFAEADAFRTRLIGSYRESFRNVHTADSQEDFAEAIAVHFPSELTRMTLARFRAMTKGGGSA